MSECERLREDAKEHQSLVARLHAIIGEYLSDEVISDIREKAGLRRDGYVVCDLTNAAVADALIRACDLLDRLTDLLPEEDR